MVYGTLDGLFLYYQQREEDLLINTKKKKEHRLFSSFFFFGCCYWLRVRMRGGNAGNIIFIILEHKLLNNISR